MDRGGEGAGTMTAADRRPGRTYYHGIDAVRFLAALMVVLFHLGRSVNGTGSRAWPISEGRIGTSVADHVAWGAVGVEIFFIVSGLVIAQSAMRASPWRFLRSRAERLYPAVWICATVSFAVWTINGATSFLRDLLLYLKSVMLIPFSDWIDGPYWTLSHEIIFYGVVWLGLLSGRPGALRIVARGIALIAGAYWAARAVSLLGGISLPLIAGVPDTVLRLFFPIYGGYFALGMFLWMYRRGSLRWADGLCWALALWAALAPVLLPVAVTGEVPGRLLVLVSGMAAIFWASRSGGDRGRPSFRWLRIAGLATYPLYLLHFALGAYLMRLIVDGGLSADAALVIVIPVLVGLAVAIALGPEPALRRLLRRFLDHLEARMDIAPQLGGLWPRLRRRG